jgi:hypothetical protein
VITIDGTEILPGGAAAPSLYAIGYQLSKLPRYGGATIGHWTVLHHSYAAMYYAAMWRPKETWLSIHALLHDAHEAITGDVPRGWKTDDLRTYQHELDQRIYTSLHISTPDLLTARLVKTIDNQLGYNEAQVYAPQTAPVILREGINPQDAHGPKAVKYAETELSMRRYNSEKCGTMYASMVKELLKSMEMHDSEPAPETC